MLQDASSIDKTTYLPNWKFELTPAPLFIFGTYFYGPEPLDLEEIRDLLSKNPKERCELKARGAEGRGELVWCGLWRCGGGAVGGGLWL